MPMARTIELFLGDFTVSKKALIRDSWGALFKMLPVFDDDPRKAHLYGKLRQDATDIIPRAGPRVLRKDLALWEYLWEKAVDVDNRFIVRVSFGSLERSHLTRLYHDAAGLKDGLSRILNTGVHVRWSDRYFVQGMADSMIAPARFLDDSSIFEIRLTSAPLGAIS